MNVTQKMKRKDFERLKKRAFKINSALKKLFPKARIILNYRNHWELLVAVQLSAQCTDIMVNKVTEKLFKKYRTLDDYIKAKPKEFEEDVYSTGFYRNKTKNILAAAKMIKKKYNGNIPKTMEELLRVPGVARKTANVVLGNAHGIIEGIAVDTHVKRLARVLGLSKENSPEKIERDLMELLPKKEWFHFTYRVIEYGRKYCVARPHTHARCPLARFHHV
ncbi:MAG: endonuclease III [Patescibacteria group bacterium]|mgnify:CR=1 FL=1